MSCLRTLVQKGKNAFILLDVLLHGNEVMLVWWCQINPVDHSPQSSSFFSNNNLLLSKYVFLYCFLQEESNGWAYWKGNVVEYKRLQSSSGNIYKQWTQLGHSPAAEETVPQQGASSKKWSIFQIRSTAPLVNVMCLLEIFLKYYQYSPWTMMREARRDGFGWGWVY